MVNLDPLYKAIQDVKEFVGNVMDMIKKVNIPLDFLPGELKEIMGAIGLNSTDIGSLFKSGAEFFRFILNLKDAAFGLKPLLGMMADAQAFCPVEGNTTFAAKALYATLLNPSSTAGLLTSSVVTFDENGAAIETPVDPVDPNPAVANFTGLAVSNYANFNYLDAVQCMALASAGIDVNGTYAVKVAGSVVLLDGSRCFDPVRLKRAGIDFAKVFPEKTSNGVKFANLTTPEALASMARTYQVLRGALSRVRPVTNNTATVGLPLPPLPGLGFCFTPTITEGPCFVLRTKLSGMLAGVNDGISKIQLVEPVAVKGLSSLFGPLLVKAANVLVDVVLPWVADFLRDAIDFAIKILNAIGIDLTPAAGRNLLAAPWDGPHDTSHVMHVPRMAAAINALRAYEMEQAALHSRPFTGRMLLTHEDAYDGRRSRRLKLSMTFLFSMLDSAKEFIDDGQKWIVDTANDILQKLPLNDTVKALDGFLTVAKPVQKVLNWVTPWIGRIMGAVSDTFRATLVGNPDNARARPHQRRP